MDSSSSPILEPSTTDMKKQLIEHFQESFGMMLLMAVKIYKRGQKPILPFVPFLQNLQINVFMDV